MMVMVVVVMVVVLGPQYTHTLTQKRFHSFCAPPPTPLFSSQMRLLCKAGLVCCKVDGGASQSTNRAGCALTLMNVPWESVFRNGLY